MTKVVRRVHGASSAWTMEQVPRYPSTGMVTCNTIMSPRREKFRTGSRPQLDGWSQLAHWYHSSFMKPISYTEKRRITVDAGK